MLRHISLLSTLLLISPALTAPVPDDSNKPVAYFPTTVGTKWVYKDGEAEWTDIIVGVKEKDGKKVVTIHTLDKTSKDDKGYLSGIVTVAPDGLHWSQSGLMVFDPPYQDLKLPHKDGNKWEFKSMLFSSKYEGTMAAYGPEKVEVPAGKYMAIRVEATDRGKNAPRTKMWYAPNVGMVKAVHNEGKNVRVLKAFTPGKD